MTLISRISKQRQKTQNKIHNNNPVQSDTPFNASVLFTNVSSFPLALGNFSS